MAKSGRAAATPAIAALQAAGVSFVLHEYVHDPRVTAYGDEAAQALSAAPSRVLKTLVIAGGGTFAIAVVPSSNKLSVKAASAALQLPRPALAAPADVTRVTGYVLGGVAPLGGRKPLATAIDESALRFDTVFCSAGRRGLEVELAPADLIAVTSAVVARLTAP